MLLMEQIMNEQEIFPLCCRAAGLTEKKHVLKWKYDSFLKINSFIFYILSRAGLQRHKCKQTQASHSPDSSFRGILSILAEIPPTNIQ